jgi:alpha-amylase
LCNYSLQARRDAGIVAKSKLEILCAEGDMYVARITGTRGSLVLKLGPRYDMGALLPKQDDGWAKAAVGKDYCVWIKQNAEEIAAAAEQQ